MIKKSVETIKHSGIAKKGDSAHNIAGQPSSRRTINTSVSLNGSSADNFVTKRVSGTNIRGSNKTSI